MFDLKNMDVGHLGHYIIMGIILLVVVAIVVAFVGPVLASAIPSVFGGGLGVTDTLLFLILLRLSSSK